MTIDSITPSGARFTTRLEAFSDLVFGFSLSLLATRLDVPARVEDIFTLSRWMPVIITFGFVCRFWIEHYRIFRHHFIAGMFDAVVNFVFLFGIAIFPYAVQTFLRFQLLLPSFALYLGDLGLVMATLAILRIQGLRQRRADADESARLHDWRRSLMQGATALLLVIFIFALSIRANFRTAMEDFGLYFGFGILLIVFVIRRAVRRLPAFLR
jgi:uncharacterized membrane protein